MLPFFMNHSIQKMYEPIAASYERINHLLTLGLDRRWRKKLIQLAAGRAAESWLDMCTGTGETAVELYQKTGAKISAVDFSPAMLAEARKKSDPIDWIEARADALPFPDRHFDGITLSFALRNLNENRAVCLSRLRELRRVLKPGGRFLMLETSQPKNPLIRLGFRLYIKWGIAPLGNRLSKTQGAYDFLAASMRAFYSADEWAALLREAGFAGLQIRPLLCGAAAIHTSIKPD